MQHLKNQLRKDPKLHPRRQHQKDRHLHNHSYPFRSHANNLNGTTDIKGHATTHRVGALVVSPDGTTIEGIVSERDVVNALAKKFDSLNTLHVRDIMTVTLHTCTPDSTVSEIMATMTQNRIRHIPVIDANKNLLSIVSIGDIVKHHVDELAGENEALKSYVASGS